MCSTPGAQAQMQQQQQRLHPQQQQNGMATGQHHFMQPAQQAQQAAAASPPASGPKPNAEREQSLSLSQQHANGVQPAVDRQESGLPQQQPGPAALGAKPSIALRHLTLGLLWSRYNGATPLQLQGYVHSITLQPSWIFADASGVSLTCERPPPLPRLQPHCKVVSLSALSVQGLCCRWTWRPTSRPRWPGEPRARSCRPASPSSAPPARGP